MARQSIGKMQWSGPHVCTEDDAVNASRVIDDMGSETGRVVMSWELGMGIVDNLRWHGNRIRQLEQWGMVAAYIVAIVTANLIVARYGQPALVVTAAVLIPFDLVTRDVLHERWQGPSLVRNMAALILSGSVIAALMNIDASRVALASFVAFTAAQTVNALVFAVLVDRTTRFKRMNVSNFFAAAIDSTVFPLIAFAVVDWRLSVAQWGTKFACGLLMTWFIVKKGTE